MSRMKVAVSTVGCRANQSDSSRLVRHLDPKLIELVDDPQSADIAIINTCCVTAQAERDCRKLARRALSSSRLILTGCAVSADPGFAEGLGAKAEARGGGDRDPRELADWLNDLAAERLSVCAAPFHPDRFDAAGLLGRTRGLLKVQSGCRHMCAYCIVPKARGPERSVPLGDVIAEVAAMRDHGVREIVLTGVQLGAWGKDLPGRPVLAELTRRAAEAASPGRIRLSSLEPWSLTEGLAEVVAEHPGVCRHLHLPLQSGDDGVLQRMRRGYTARQYLEAIDRVRHRCEEIAIGTDILTGFPGEDEAAFANTMEVLRTLAPAYVHAFPYSPRKGTPAAGFPDRPAKTAAKARVGKVRRFAEDSSLVYRRRFVGSQRRAIIEDAQNAEARALTDNFIPVTLVADEAETGTIVDVRIVDVASDGRVVARKL